MNWTPRIQEYRKKMRTTLYLSSTPGAGLAWAMVSLDALMMEDMYLAGSMLMVLSLLSVFGTLVSDFLLLWLDPRIRFKSGGK